MKNPFDGAPLQNEVCRSERRLHAGKYQIPDVVPAKKAPGFNEISVYFTLEKKDTTKKKQGANQDNILADAETGLFGVFDGVGSSSFSEEASRIAEWSIPDNYEKQLRKSIACPQNELCALDIYSLSSASSENALQDEHLAKKILALNQAFLEANLDIAVLGSYTTACVGLIHKMMDQRQFVIVANVGDSIAYLKNLNNQLQMLTFEDDLINLFLSRGELTLSKLYEMKANPRKKYLIAGRTMNYFELHSTITHALGDNQSIIKPKISVCEISVGDEILLVTDGITDKFEIRVKSVPPAKQLTTMQTDIEKFDNAYSEGQTIAERLNNLRSTAKSSQSYKEDDDIAAVAVKTL